MKTISWKRSRVLKVGGAAGVTVLVIYYLITAGRSRGGDDEEEEVFMPRGVAVGRTQLKAQGGVVPFINYEKMGNFEPPEDPPSDAPGEGGKAYHLPSEFKKEADASIARYGMNMVASDKISLERSVKDTRPPECKHWNYPENMGLTASVVIVFRNEGLSVVMRNCHTIITRSPKEMLKEIILVDDMSSFDEVKSEFDEAIKKFNGKVRMIHNAEREGLIRARSIGAKAAVGDVVIFLDAHCEVNKNWLPPLLAPIYENRKSLTVPFVDSIDWNNFEYRPTYSEGARYRGAFEWGFFYKELELNAEMSKEYPYKSMPYKAPNHAGGLLAIERNYFLELGAYDPGLLIWGGENFELSFKVWMCGGRQLWVPCSRVGHVYRGPRRVHDDIGKKWREVERNKGSLSMLNYKRVIDVWFDDKHREYFYAREPLSRYIDSGDISEQLAFKEKNHCKSFQWFMDNVAPDIYDKYPPPPPNKKWGELKNVEKDKCVDTMGRPLPAKLGVYHCHGQGTNQLVRLNMKGQMGIGERCVDVQNDHYVKLIYCPDADVSGSWELDEDTQVIKHNRRNKCLSVDTSDDLILADCDSSDKQQKWVFREVHPK